MKCSHCNGYQCIPDVVYRNHECYHAGERCIHHCRCQNCNKVIAVSMQNTTKALSVEKSDRKEGDWG